MTFLNVLQARLNIDMLCFVSCLTTWLMLYDPFIMYGVSCHVDATFPLLTVCCAEIQITFAPGLHMVVRLCCTAIRWFMVDYCHVCAAQAGPLGNSHLGHRRNGLNDFSTYFERALRHAYVARAFFLPGFLLDMLPKMDVCRGLNTKLFGAAEARAKQSRSWCSQNSFSVNMCQPDSRPNKFCYKDPGGQ